MYPDWSVTVFVAVVVLVWLGVLTFLVLSDRKFLSSLFTKNGERDIRKKLEELLSSVEGFDNRLSVLGKDIKELEGDGWGHIQRVELLRFNPYNDTGGDQSFCLVLLDKKGDGVVVTSLHTRSGTRIFSKPVTEGKAEKYQLSKEEELVVKKAMEK